MFTTNEEDLREAEKLQRRLQQQDDDDEDDKDYVTGTKTGSSSSGYRIPNVSIDSGAHKYVLISAILPTTSSASGGGERQYFVVSRRGADYHRNVAEPFVECLEQGGYSNIRILGGGRIALDDTKKTISIYGYSYGFGLADHALSQSVVEKDPRYHDYQISWSNDGY